MGKIIILDENTSNKIAAGEVIERPASVVKELVENSIDAGAGNISVEIKNGGITYIRVVDNGSGIDEDDAEIAFERHATSKIRSANDLDSIATLGFRGEALASIAAVSNVELTTRMQKNSYGTYINIQGGTVREIKQKGCPPGTAFTIKDLFYNTPARFKFLKKDSTEAGYISDIISRIALANPQISFRLISNNSTVIHTPGNNDLLSTIFSIYGKETARQVSEIRYEENGIKVTGYAGKPEIARGTRNHQSLFVNGRYVRSRIVTSAIDEAYKTFLMKNKHAFIVLHIEINPLLIDINVHPTKMEVKFSEEQNVFRSIYHAISNALLSNSQIRTAQLDRKDEKGFEFLENPGRELKYTQENINLDRLYVKDNPPDTATKIKSTVSENITVEKENNNTGFDKTSSDNQTEFKVFENRKEKKAGAAKLPGMGNKYASDIDTDRVMTVYERENSDDKTDGYREGSLLKDVRIIGQVFSTYILLQQNDELILIDQHAAHERIMYESMRKKYMNNESLSQSLLSPVVIELTNQEIKLLEEEAEFFIKLGFMYENFGNNSIILRAVPYAETTESVKEMFVGVVDAIMSSGTNDYRKMADETIYTIACKAAIKANKRLDNLEIDNILTELKKLDNPFTCPHGRPTVIKLTKHDLEKMFKRIV